MRGSPDRRRVLPCARHARSLDAQLVALDSPYCAPSAGGTAPPVFLPTSALGSARHGLSPCSPRIRRPHGGGGRMRSRTSGCRGRRDAHKSHYALRFLAADCAEESLADRQLGFTTLDVRSIWAWHLGVAYATERGQRHEDRGAAPAAHRRRVRKWQGNEPEAAIPDSCVCSDAVAKGAGLIAAVSRTCARTANRNHASTESCGCVIARRGARQPIEASPGTQFAGVCFKGAQVICSERLMRSFTSVSAYG